MTEDLADDLRVDGLRQEQSRAGVPEVVEAVCRAARPDSRRLSVCSTHHLLTGFVTDANRRSAASPLPLHRVEV